MLDDDEGRLALGMVGLQPFAQMPEHGQVDAAGRLVEQHQPRPGHERHGGVKQLLLPVAQGARLLAGKMRKAEEFDHLLGGLAQPGIGAADQARIHRALVLLAGEDEVVAHRKLRKHLQQLKGAADAEPIEIAGAHAGRPLAVDAHLAAVRQSTGRARN